MAWVYESSEAVTGVHRAARDQWLRASQSIPLSIVEGNGKASDADHGRCFETSRGSALECAAIQEVLVVGKALEDAVSRGRKTGLDRMAAMLPRLGGRGYRAGEEPAVYRRLEVEREFDFEGVRMQRAEPVSFSVLVRSRLQRGQETDVIVIEHSSESANV